MPTLDFSIVSLLPTALTAISCGFVVTRLVMGSWTRYPHFLAAAIVSATAFVGLAGVENAATLQSFVGKVFPGVIGAFIAVKLMSLIFAVSRREDQEF